MFHTPLLKHQGQIDDVSAVESDSLNSCTEGSPSRNCARLIIALFLHPENPSKPPSSPPNLHLDKIQ